MNIRSWAFRNAPVRAWIRLTQSMRNRPLLFDVQHLVRSFRFLHHTIDLGISFKTSEKFSEGRMQYGPEVVSFDSMPDPTAHAATATDSDLILNTQWSALYSLDDRRNPPNQ